MYDHGWLIKSVDVPKDLQSCCSGLNAGPYSALNAVMLEISNVDEESCYLQLQPATAARWNADTE